MLDTDYKSGCAKVIYRSDDDRMVLPKMYFDPVDQNYIYIALRNQVSLARLKLKLCLHKGIFRMNSTQVRILLVISETINDK